MKNPEVHDYLTRNDGLATRLKKARGTMTMLELAIQAGWKESGKSKVSKIESGKQLPSVEDLEIWAALTGVDERLLGQWKVMLVEAESFRTDYQQRMREGQKAVQQEYTDLAAETTHFRFFESAVVPRYLQVREYTHAVLQEYHDDYGTIDDVDEATDERQASSRYLYDTSKRFDFLIDEHVLRSRRFPPEVMRSQMDRLQSVIGLRHVRLGIYPSLSRPTKKLVRSSFELFDDVGFIETFLSDGPRLLIDDVVQLDKFFNQMWDDAVEGDTARRLILDAISSLPE
jgi:transcriptional regulator with XRE-family HTH domain